LKAIMRMGIRNLLPAGSVGRVGLVHGYLHCLWKRIIQLRFSVKITHFVERSALLAELVDTKGHLKQYQLLSRR